MSGSISGIDYSVLFNTAGSTSLVSIANGYGSGSTVASGDPLSALKLAEANQTKDIATEAKDPLVSRDIASFKKAVGQAKDVKTALSNPAVLTVLLTANGLSSLIGQQALVRKALLSDPTSSTSLVSKLGNTALKSLATTFRFDTKGLAALQDPKVQATLSSGYAEVKWRQSLDKTTPGLSYALDFRARAASFKTADSILGDPTGWEVVLTALGIPQQLAFQGLPAQEKAITSQLDLTKLQNPHFVDGLTQQYLLNKQAAVQAAGSTGPTLTSLSVQSMGLIV